MNNFLKAILILLVLLLVLPVTVGLVRLLGWVIGAAFGLIALPFGIIGGLIGILFRLFFLVVPILLFVLFCVACVWFVGLIIKGSPPRKFDEDEGDHAGVMRDIQKGLSRMEKRIDSLETILGDNR